MDLFVQMMSMLTAGCFVDSWVPIGVVTESEHAESEEITGVIEEGHHSLMSSKGC
jgi:hypothetical protein